MVLNPTLLLLLWLGIPEATEDEYDQRTRGKENRRKKMDNRFELQLEEDEVALQDGVGWRRVFVAQVGAASRSREELNSRFHSRYTFREIGFRHVLL